MMRIFTLFTTDTRLSLPTLTLLDAEDDVHAIELAEHNLAQSHYHRAVELREGNRAIYESVKVA
jgi:hypothetical protein